MKYFTFFFGSAKSSKSTTYFTHSSYVSLNQPYAQRSTATYGWWLPYLTAQMWPLLTSLTSTILFSPSVIRIQPQWLFFQFLRHTKLLLTSRPLHTLIPLLTTVLLLSSRKPTSQFSCKLKCHRPQKTFSNCLIQGQVTLITSCYFFRAHPM